ncbi:tRNA (adenosine(37)-N6)-threonylcarbamoyltransferase complex ATPase subunit type 1 TsaE [Schleiferilactobacillus shenzhenensis]|uniref:tRNA threonylcarbamoyladenosine biosynthesis protein TsaE n=1 Tax=Schleiferilactobacillus shenzhenensis LY-73 TaxID=1231336 RepID=U4TY33_9LACO|nr:tRNA (adenosine(37)-N6)-threonylcarbamoyltransferase complex ATPase subunit type 1 TsaE [Schleiferilactobacillus shenzhenensis]ERL66247.1 YdiB [Schleiferilactobacillus shenzhenensis LY-73]
MREIITHDAAETVRLGRALGQLAQAGDVILLDGDLGAGKTTMTKGIARGLGITGPVKSPTFTLIREYQDGRLPLYHMDVYRLENGGAEDLGLDEYFDGDGVSVVEWSEFITDLLPPTYVRIRIARTDSTDDTRRITITAHGGDYVRYEDVAFE